MISGTHRARQFFMASVQATPEGLAYSSHLAPFRRVIVGFGTSDPAQSPAFYWAVPELTSMTKACPQASSHDSIMATVGLDDHCSVREMACWVTPSRPASSA